MALPKNMRLKGHRTFNYIHKNSIKYHGKLMTFKLVKSNPKILSSHKPKNSSNNLRIAISISKKFFLMNISNSVGIDSNDLAKRGESLIRKSTNRYLTTVRIAFRAKQRRFDDFDGLLEESTIKPVQRSIIELSDEQDQPDLLPG